MPDGVAIGDVVEKDWSFLESSGADLQRALAAGALSPSSRVLAVTPTASFVSSLLASSPCELLVAAHESLYVLAGVKEAHDEVRCFHLEGGGGGRAGGVVEAVPERFDDFDVVFMCYFPGMGISAASLLKSLAKRCSKGETSVEMAPYPFLALLFQTFSGLSLRWLELTWIWLIRLCISFSKP